MVADDRRLWGEGPSDEHLASDAGGRWTGAQIATVIAVLLLIFAVYIHSSRNTAAIDDNGARIATLEARAGKTADVASGREIQRLEKRIANLEQELVRLKRGERKGRAAAGAAAGVLVSAPGMLAPQRLQPPPGNAAERLLAPDQGSAEWSQTPPEGDLPRYQRSISPDGKLILRKLQ